MKSKTYIKIAIAVIILIIISVLSLIFGNKLIPINELIDAIFNSANSQYGFIVYEYRIPRLIISILVGMSLAIAGTIFQGVLRNPLASTDVLGIGKGAGFFACLVISVPSLKFISMPVAAMIGGLLAVSLIYILAKKSYLKNTNIVIMGIAISAFFDSGIQFLNYNNKANIQTVLVWLTGSVWGRYWDEVKIILVFSAVLIPLSIILSNKIDILSLGDNIAVNLGEKVTTLRMTLLLIGTLLTASSVSVSGTIGFIGLIAPHIAKSMAGYKHSVVIPLSGVIGAIILVTSDMVGRTILAPLEVPVGIVTAILGAPYFLYLLLKKK